MTPSKRDSSHTSEDLPITPSKKSKSSPSKISSASDSSQKERERSQSKITVEVKKVLLEQAMELAYKSLDFHALSTELGIAHTALKDQFKPSRSNLRKAVLDLV